MDLYWQVMSWGQNDQLKIKRGGDRTMLREPAAREVRLVALRLLDDAVDVARHLEDAGIADAELLHDSRVAIRRLRSWLRLWRVTLSDSISRADERRIRDITRATGPARDLDVRLALIEKERHHGSKSQQHCIASIIEQLDADRRAAASQAIDAARNLIATRDHLAKRLEIYPVHVQTPITAEERFGSALAGVVRAASDLLKERLATVHSRDDHDATHAARIAAKNLRYLLAALPVSLRGTPGIIKDLRRLQRFVGDVNDTFLFARELASNGKDETRPCVDFILRKLDARGARAYTRFERRWLGDASAPFFARVNRLAERYLTASTKR
jgi:CHAD domain-containing protein